MRTLVFLLEELSMRRLLEGLLPRFLPEDVNVVYLVFEGKQDLEKNIERKIRGWQLPDSAFVIVRDQDSAPDCRDVKRKLVELANRSGKAALVRIACRTLEAWVAGDLDAVSRAFDDPKISKAKNTSKFRNPDTLGSAYDELRMLVPTYQKVDGARRLGPLLAPETNTSLSFKALLNGVLALVATRPLS